MGRMAEVCVCVCGGGGVWVGGGVIRTLDKRHPIDTLPVSAG